MHDTPQSPPELPTELPTPTPPQAPSRVKKFVRYGLLAVLGFGVGFAVISTISKMSSHSSSNSNSIDGLDPNSKQKIDWATLRGLDLKTGTLTPELKKLDGNLIELPGFMVPLEDDSSKVTEFLLVPSPQACIHVPPPPPNQMVHVKMASGRSTEMAFGPIWLLGKMQITDYNGPYGVSSFFVTGISTRPYD
jgi:hypothetical protein